MVESARVHIGVHHTGIVADVFHDVDFTAGGPAHRVHVGAQHPDGGPRPPAARELRPHLDPAVRPRCLIPGVETRRRILRVLAPLLPPTFRGVGLVARIGILFLAGLDDEMTAFDPRVFASVRGVILELAIAHEPLFISPFCGIRQTIAVEFVRPDQFPIPGLDRQGKRERECRERGHVHAPMAPPRTPSVKTVTGRRRWRSTAVSF